MDYSDITGFEGADLAQQNEMIRNYVNGIASQSTVNPFIASVPSEEMSSADKK